MDVFGALDDPTRREVLALLGTGDRRASDLATATGSSRPAMSRHLRILLETGLVEDRRVPDDARARVFRLRPQSLAGVQAFLDQVQADWNVQLRSFGEHVARRSAGDAQQEGDAP